MASGGVDGSGRDQCSEMVDDSLCHFPWERENGARKTCLDLGSLFISDRQKPPLGHANRNPVTRQSAPLRTHWDRRAQTDGGFVRPDEAGSRSAFKSPVLRVPDFEFPLSSLGRLGWMKLTGEGKMLERWQRAPHLQILQVLGSDVDPDQALIFYVSGFLYLAGAHRLKLNLHFF